MISTLNIIEDNHLGGVYLNNVKAFGQFEERRGYVFRTSAYLQWGSSTKSLGAFLFLNPGRTELLTGALIGVGEVLFGEVKVDLMMEQKRKLVERIYGNEKLEGRVHLYYLFSLRNTIEQDPIDLFEVLAKLSDVPVIDAIPSMEELRTHPWICKCWGINSNPNWKQLSARKQEWTKQLEDAGIPMFGKPHRNGIDYFHILPHLKTTQQELLDDLVEIYRKEVQGSDGV